MHSNGTDNHAVDDCEKESDPTFFCEQYRRQDGEEAGKIIQMEHFEDSPPIEASPIQECE